MSRSNRGNSLPPDSFTARRLQHATPEHLHQTTRRVFIGPLPEGWLKTHRKQWYRQYTGSRGARVPSFTAAQPVVSVSHDAEEGGGADAGANGDHAAEGGAEELARQSADVIGEGLGVGTTTETALGSQTALSTTSLLHSQRDSSVSASASIRNTTIEGEDQDEGEPQPTSILQDSRIERAANGIPTPKVRFSQASKLQLRARASRLAAKGSLRSLKIKDGEMLKVDKMLVRIDITQQSLRDDYDEKLSQGVETRTLDKWREFMIVCRKHTEGDANAVLQFYQTRVIAVSEGDNVKKKPKVQMLLGAKSSKVNMYSSLDKTLCVWTTVSGRTTIYYLRAQSTATAVEWYTFLRGLLGDERPDTLQINVPDLNVSLRLDDPFGQVEAAKTLDKAAAGDDDALARAISDESGAAGAIVARCVSMLNRSPEWTDVLEGWAKDERIGLAWKRYDRLEWIHGAVEQRMYGTIAMLRTHDLELRLKDHYPVSAKGRHGSPVLEEPPPVEGFLIRLTSQQGKEQRLGKMLFKRLYFSTQNQYLVFLRPASASPPPPPKISPHVGNGTPTAKDFIDRVPLSYDIDPFPLTGKSITWVGSEPKSFETHDKAAAAEAERNANTLLVCDGFIDLCDVQTVRDFSKGAIPVDESLQSGQNVDFHAAVPNSHSEDGATAEIDEDRVLELVLTNGLVIRLQAFNKAARDIWRESLQALVAYWTQRIKADTDLYKSTREQNLKVLGIDERAEAIVGQFSHKWEVGKSYASPILYNMCGIAGCRPIHVSGVLFRKPRKHTTFTRCHVVLSNGHLLIFQDTLRKRTGKKLVHIHHERIASMSLRGSYIYSGLLTEGDLLYQNQTFDSNAPGHHTLPRIYLEDSWTSSDEDAMTTFVVWHPKSKAWFKSSKTVDDIRNTTAHEAETSSEKVKTKLTRVSQLGATGRSVVFKARSRAERDHWVLAIQNAIERLGEGEEVRLVEEGN
ncbi:related to PH domain protein [Ramularia collo-cygni]|uniref:Related to PH domain protein n=1 Tax=Ramularia collo-cygni TaxID=112498 RepID=A0A2D3V4Z2_9PEZI|nr:related to PH domain protein [Ramularia collo-cygni]CZT19767.1 related to PH domain protein [Ramularia collo-cygni]